MQFFHLFTTAAVALALLPQTTVAGPIDIQQSRTKDEQPHSGDCKVEILHDWFTEPFLVYRANPGSRSEITIETHSAPVIFAFAIGSGCTGIKDKKAGKIPEGFFVKISTIGISGARFLRD
ncbi:hypothetical protein PgNI_10789 [Pyricularia grisea]|uniref:Uncharacterized protein n=1 Tax=Pyricularia grisea TaxID=148305 RepID=A0A6P8AZI9_PYRGI|nr:hypothetical protein PgNI_10789 [Pyricularia grisea]TLD07803.1 hypothetical protein PgNI_10789 [Pyricularia grisea]